MESQANAYDELRFFLVDDEPTALADRLSPGASTRWASRLAAARAALREAQQAEYEERTQVGRARGDGLTATHATLLQARQSQTQAALAAVEDLNRRSAWLRQAITAGEESLAQQRRFVEKLRRELAEIGD